jgi:hypothetical protein
LSNFVIAQDESAYLDKYCLGKKEVVIPGGRIDCLADKFAAEFEFGYNWKEAIGQSLYYAMMTNTLPMIYLIDKNTKNYQNLLKTIKFYNLDIKVKYIPYHHKLHH